MLSQHKNYCVCSSTIKFWNCCSVCHWYQHEFSHLVGDKSVLLQMDCTVSECVAILSYSGILVEFSCMRLFTEYAYNMFWDYFLYEQFKRTKNFECSRTASETLGMLWTAIGEVALSKVQITGDFQDLKMNINFCGRSKVWITIHIQNWWKCSRVTSLR